MRAGKGPPGGRPVRAPPRMIHVDAEPLDHTRAFMNTSSIMLTPGARRRSSPRASRTASVLLAAALLVAPWASITASAATPADAPTAGIGAADASTRTAGPWAVVEALLQRIMNVATAAASVSTTDSGGTGGEVNQGIDPDGGTGDDGDGGEPPPPSDDDSTSGGGDGGSL